METDKKMPIDQDKTKNPSGDDRRDHKAYDNDFINAYCQNPMEGKTAALIKAGFVGDNIPQEAYRMFKRLSGKIKERTTELIESLDSLAAGQLQSILSKSAEEVGYSNMNQAIKQGLDYAGRKPGDTITIKKEESIDDMETELEALRLKRMQKTGRDLH